MSRKLLIRWWPLPIGIAAFVAQQVGWDRIGRAVLSVARVAGEVAWPVAREGWMLLAAGLLVLWLNRSGPAAVVTRLGHIPRRWLLLGLAGAGVLSVLAVVVLLAPPVFVPEDPALNLQELYRARNDVRTTLLQAIAGLVLLLGAYFTYRQVQNSTRALQHTQQQVEIARAGQVTERFTRAIDQLGQHGRDKLDIRLGGIYALERIARDSTDDRTAVVEVFCAYVREHAPWPPRAGQYVADAPLEEVLALQARAPDVQAILTVLGRGVFAGQSLQLDLRDADLRKADLQQAQLRKTLLLRAHLRGAHLRGADLRGADLTGANLRRADLDGALLRGANLRGANLRGANLTGTLLLRADLTGADLTGANLRRADLDGALLRRADLRGANLTRANLTEADLREADLREANLTEANLRGADLTGADLAGVRLTGVNLTRAHLLQADLRGANLTGTLLDGAILTLSDLTEANLRRADLTGADLTGANLRGADLTEADLAGVRLTRAIADRRTQWPERFDWKAAGVEM